MQYGDQKLLVLTKLRPEDDDYSSANIQKKGVSDPVLREFSWVRVDMTVSIQRVEWKKSDLVAFLTLTNKGVLR